jgi:hypothetical protein
MQRTEDTQARPVRPVRLAGLLASLFLAGAVTACADNVKRDFTEDFDLASCTWSSTGSNRFWVLEPGHQLAYEGEDRRDGFLELTITTLDETELVDGVQTRVVEEREWEEGELLEVSRNFLAVCQETGDVFYFGEEVDIYEDGEVVGHEGGWRAGEDGASAGILMPGRFLLGARYYQELAPGVAQDRAEHAAMGLEVQVPAGTFQDCVEVVETTPLSPSERSSKTYAPGVGLIVDDALELVSFTP